MSSHITKLHLIVGLMIGSSFFILMLIEFMLARQRKLQLHLRQDSRANFAIFLIRIILNIAISGTLLYSILDFTTLYSLHLTDHLSKFSYWLLLILGLDFMYYWFHRFSHVCRWGWASHVVHHSSNYLNYII